MAPCSRSHKIVVWFKKKKEKKNKPHNNFIQNNYRISSIFLNQRNFTSKLKLKLMKPFEKKKIYKISKIEQFQRAKFQCHSIPPSVALPTPSQTSLQPTSSLSIPSLSPSHHPWPLASEEICSKQLLQIVSNSIQSLNYVEESTNSDCILFWRSDALASVQSSLALASDHLREQASGSDG